MWHEASHVGDRRPSTTPRILPRAGLLFLLTVSPFIGSFVALLSRAALHRSVMKR
jgi:hypothetical protein